MPDFRSKVKGFLIPPDKSGALTKAGEVRYDPTTGDFLYRDGVAGTDISLRGMAAISSTLATMQNGWATQGGRQALHYWKDANEVHVRGCLNSNAASAAICMTLPAGYQPSNQVSVPLTYWDGGTVYKAGEAHVLSTSQSPAGGIELWNSTSVFSTAMAYVMVQIDFRTDR